ncbi:MAG: hypothetical protein J6L77_02290 [Coprococcus sp.]|nr:hypothetical protein [Coprococcus sp.]
MEKKRIELLLERTFIFDPNVYMTIVVTIEGDVGEEEICEAVRKAYTQNQTTMSKIVLDEQGKLYQEMMQESGCKVFVDSRDWQEIMHENERKPFRIKEGELVRTFVIPRGTQKDIYLMAHHVACDGGGLLILAEDILDNLQGKEVAYKPTKVIAEKSVIKRGNLKFIEKLALKNLNKKWGKEKRVFGWDVYDKVHEEFWKNKQSEISFTWIEGTELEKLKEECKKAGVTVNSYLTAKLMQKYPECKKLGIPVSVRGEERSISCLISSAPVYSKYDTSKDFSENLATINETIKKELTSEGAIYRIPQFVAYTDPTLLEAGYIQNVIKFESSPVDSMARVLGLYGDERYELGITNLKEITFPSDYDRFKVTGVIPVAPLIATTEKVFTISTYNGKMLIAENKVKQR